MLRMNITKSDHFGIIVLILFTFLAIGFTSIGETLVDSTGNVVQGGMSEALLLDCSFEEALTCMNGEVPLRREGISFVEGKAGKGVLVDGEDVLAYPAVNNFDSNKGTIEFWVKPNWDTSSDKAHRFFYTRSDGWSFFIGTEQSNYHMYFNTKYGTIKYSIYGWKKDTWHHVVATWTKLETRLYIDGVYQAKDKYYLPSVEPDTIYIGVEDTQRNQAEAVIDELKIYNYVLSTEQIKEDYNSYAVVEEPPLMEIPEESPVGEVSPPEEELEYIGEDLAPEPEPEPGPKPIDNSIYLWAMIVFLLGMVSYLLVRLKKK